MSGYVLAGKLLDGPALRLEIRSQALRRLGLREHSRKELEVWLLRKFGKENRTVIVEVLAQIEGQGGISDERYAQAMTRHQEQRGKGPAYIQAKLREKGVQRSLAQIREVIPEEEELESVKRFLDRRYPDFQNRFLSEPALKARAIQALLRRGFSLEMVRKALNQVGTGEGD